jgi:phenylacetate-CoA ligase
VIRVAWILLQSRHGSRRPLPELRRLEERRLRAVVAHAWAHVPVHRRRLTDAGVGPDTVRTLADVGKLPLTPKRLLRETPPAELLVRGVAPGRCHVVRTSGSTGEPLRVYLGPAEVDWHRAAGLRILQDLGFRWRDRTLEIRALTGSTFGVQRLGIAPKRWVSILDPPGAQLREIVEYRPDVLCASVSTLDDLARCALANGVAVPAPRLVVVDSEPLLPAARARIARAFGRQPTDVYGLVELSNFAWECAHRTGLHVAADTHLVEVVDDDDRPVPAGIPGRVVVTDLVARTMPMLRYDTGDRAALVDDPCPCGRTFPRLVGLVGRSADAVRLPDGRRVHWPYFHETLARFEDLERWQVIQEDLHRLRLRVLVRPERRTALVGPLAAELAALLGPDVTVDIEPWDVTGRDPTRKDRPVVSRLLPP